MQIEEQLVAIEKRLWTNDAVVYRDSLAEEAILIFPETGALNREVAVEAILAENAEGRRWAEVQFDEVRGLRLAGGVTLLTYRVAARWAHEESAYPALASSIYVKRDGAWKLIFHQQTPLRAG